MLVIPVNVYNHVSMKPDTYMEVQTNNICQNMSYAFICFDKILRLKFWSLLFAMQYKLWWDVSAWIDLDKVIELCNVVKHNEVRPKCH